MLGEPAGVSVRRGRRALGFALGAVFLVVACSASDTAPAAVATATPVPAVASAAPTPTVTASPTATPSPTATATPLPLPAVDDPELEGRARLLMLESFDFFTGPNPVAIEELGELGYRGSIIPLIELTRFVAYDNDINVLTEALERLTGVSMDGSDWAGWYRWLGERPDLEPIPGYVSWKGSIYSEIDDDFRSFFREDVERRVPFWGVQWGGVSLDGIPPLENPNHIPADEATYLEPDDPVFGVSVGGETVAYP